MDLPRGGWGRYLFIYLFMVIRRPLGHVTRNYLTAVPHLETIILPCPWGWHCLNPVPPTSYRIGSGVNGVDASRLALLYVGRMGRPVLDLTIVTVVMFFPLWLDPFARFFPRFSLCSCDGASIFLPTSAPDRQRAGISFLSTTQ
jgi:hypothetical protein